MFSKYRVSFSADIQKTLTQFPHLGTRRGKPKRGLSFCGGRAGGAARRPLPPLQELLKSCPQQGSPPGSCHSTCPLCQHRGQIYLDLTVLDSTVVGAQRFTQQSARVGLGCSPAEALRCGCLRSFCSLTSAQAAQLLPMHPSHALLLCGHLQVRCAERRPSWHGWVNAYGVRAAEALRCGCSRALCYLCLARAAQLPPVSAGHLQVQHGMAACAAQRQMVSRWPITVHAWRVQSTHYYKDSQLPTVAAQLDVGPLVCGRGAHLAYISAQISNLHYTVHGTL